MKVGMICLPDDNCSQQRLRKHGADSGFRKFGSSNQKLLLVQVLFSFFLISCKEDCELVDVTDKCIFQEIILSPCFYGNSSTNDDEIVITDTASYYEFAHEIRIFPVNLNCDTARLPQIDFSKYTLLGKHTFGGGCFAEYIRKIYEDECSKVIIYEIIVEYSGGCYMLIGNWNWAYIPKLPADYTVKFVTL